PFVHLADLALGQRKHGDDVDTSGERLPGFRQGPVPGRTGENVPAGPEIPVELSLDGIQQLGDMLILVNQDRLVGLDEPARVASYRSPRRRVVAVDNRTSETSRQLT